MLLVEATSCLPTKFKTAMMVFISLKPPIHMAKPTLKQRLESRMPRIYLLYERVKRKH